jgi:hypothetical protein
MGVAGGTGLFPELPVTSDELFAYCDDSKLVPAVAAATAPAAGRKRRAKTPAEVSARAGKRARSAGASAQ